MMARIALGLALVAALALVRPLGNASAQIDPAVRDRVVPAAVQIAAVVEATANGLTTTELFTIGSGTVMSATGQILTNWHVADIETVLNKWETQAAATGQLVALRLVDDALRVLVSDGINPPEPRYTAVLAFAHAVGRCQSQSPSARLPGLC
jgi:hypothetical protein